MLSSLFRSIIIPIIALIINHTPLFIWVIIDFIVDICFFWVKKLYQFYNTKDPFKEYLKQLKNALSYNEWKKIAAEIDKLTNMDLWRQNFISKHYDYILIDDRLKLLREARLNQDSQLIISLFRSGLMRNFGGLSQKRLYTKSYLGTKFKIEEYITEVLNCLNYLNESINAPSERDNDEFIMNSKQLKLDFFHDARQSFGCTALLLQGGSLFGLCHLGVVKALYFKGLLPRIIGGSAIGAAVASLVCTLTDQELIPILINIADVIADIDRLNHDVDERYGNVIENVVKKGYSQDILIFLKFVRDTIGDLTFEEAYLKTEKILNIVVHPTHQSVTSLLNYITAPNVIIWTAIYASIGTGVLSDNVQLYVKDFNNQIVPKVPDFDVVFLKPQDVSYLQQYFRTSNRKKDDHPSNSTNSKAKNSSSSEPGNNDNTSYNYHLKESSPYTRLTELFNVNHFIISLARPYLAPLISNDLKHYHNSYGKVRYNHEGNERNNMKSKFNNQILIDENKPPVLDKNKTSVNDMEKYANDTGYNFMKLIKNLLGMEIQHRLEVMNKLGLLSDLIKRFCIDEKPSTPQSLTNIREISIVPELRYLVKDFGRVFDVHKTMENIPYWILVGERSVWPLFPLLWARCSIEFALDDLYNIHRKKG
jgi:TAG lipase/lysophosphatidylethanolamine acyltransferase